MIASMATRNERPEYLVATTRLRLVHDIEQNARITAACDQQRAIHNQTLEHLLTHRSDEPLQTSKAKGVIGIFGRLKAWRQALGEIPHLIARGGASAAHDQVQRWETTNLQHAVLIAKAAENGTEIPRRAQRRTPDEKRLYRSRRRDGRQGRNRCRIDECVRRIDRRTVHVPGLGRLRTKDDVPRRPGHPLLRDPGENARGPPQRKARAPRAELQDPHHRQAAKAGVQAPRDRAGQSASTTAWCTPSRQQTTRTRS